MTTPGLIARRLALGVCVVLLGASVVAAPTAGGYHLLKRIPLGAAPGGGEYFDYITVDSDARRIYLSHGTEVKVVDADSGALVGTIGGLKRCHGVALVKDVGKGFITDGDAAKVVVFDTATLKVTGEIKSERDTDSIFYDPASKRIFTFNGDSKNSTVIDPAKGTVVSTLPLGGAPEQAVVDGKGMIYDNLEDTNEVIALDSRTLTIKARWSVAPAGAPVAITMDRKARRLFIGGRNPRTLVMMDADTGKIIGDPFPIGDRVDANVFDPETGLVASATRDGTLHVFHLESPTTLSLVETVKTEFGAKTMGLDSKTHNLYLTTADFKPPAAPTDKQPHPQPTPVPGTFRLLIYGR
jgi:DNA-binding beta-propeller fold protein YncE